MRSLSQTIVGAIQIVDVIDTVLAGRAQCTQESGKADHRLALLAVVGGLST